MNNPAISHIDHARFPLQDLAASFAALQQSVDELSQNMQALLQAAQDMLQNIQALLDASRAAVQDATTAVHADVGVKRRSRRKTRRCSGTIYAGSEITLGSEANAE